VHFLFYFKNLKTKKFKKRSTNITKNTIKRHSLGKNNILKVCNHYTQNDVVSKKHGSSQATGQFAA
jgi:hypothetical protein